LANPFKKRIYYLHNQNYIFVGGFLLMSVAAKLSLATVGVSMALALFISAPAQAQGDAFSSRPTGPQSSPGGVMTQSPMLNQAAHGTIGPQGADATVVQGVNTAGTVRVNNLANLEALLNIIANGMEILGIAWGGPTMILGFMHMAAGSQQAMQRVLYGAAGVTGGLATPGAINWLVASARDANLFT
jgi:hypothetical protein